LADIYDIEDSQIISLDEFIDTCKQVRDIQSEEGLLGIVPSFRRLGNNKSVLIDALASRLRAGLDPGANVAYLASVMIAVEKNFVIRLNAWARPKPFEKRESFAFDVPHNHDFNFLTIGYYGPGYDTDLWTLRTKDFIGYVGEKVYLDPQPRRRLTEGRIMHYRRDIDVHLQLDPPSFSMSLNLIPKNPAHTNGSFSEQYEFDIATSSVSRLLPGVATRQADLISIAAEIGTLEIDDLVEELLKVSPNRRTRASCLSYLLSRQPENAESWLELASVDKDEIVRQQAAALKIKLQKGL
jgi:hypothetical protein